MARDGNSRLVYSTGGEPPREGGGRTKGEAPRAKPSGGKGVRVAVEPRASGRVVTVIRGIAGGSRALAELARALKAACGAGGTVRGDVIELQGDQRSDVEALLPSLLKRGGRSSGGSTPE